RGGRADGELRRNDRVRPGGAQVRPRRRARIAVRRLGGGVRQARQRQARRQGEGRRLRLEPAGRRQGAAPEAQARHRRPRPALDRHVLGSGPLRRLRDAVPRQGPRAHEAHREGGVLEAPRAGRREEGPQGDRRLGERLPPHHELQAPDQHAGGPPGHQAAHAGGQVAREDVPDLRRESLAHEVLRGLHRAPDRRDGWPGKSVHADLQRQVPGGAEVPFAHRPRLYARVRDRGRAQVGESPARRAQHARDRGEGHAGVRLPGGSEGRGGSARQAEGGRHAGEHAGQERVHRRLQAGVRGIRQGSEGREGSDRPRHRARSIARARMLSVWRRRYERLLEWLAIVLMAALAVEVTAGVIFRYSGHALVWYDEVATILLAWVTFYGSALAVLKHAHLGVPEIVRMMPPGLRVTATCFAQAFTLAFYVLLAYFGYVVLEVLATDRLVSLPEVSVAWAQSVIPVSA